VSDNQHRARFFRNPWVVLCVAAVLATLPIFWGLRHSGPSQSDGLRSILDAYVQCMRDRGIDLPGPRLQDGMLVVDGREGFPPKRYDQADTACRPIIDAAFKPSGHEAIPGAPQQLAAQRAFAACMRARGFATPEPDPRDARLAAAGEACEMLVNRQFGQR
jgi:hypothetical protein